MQLIIILIVGKKQVSIAFEKDIWSDYFQVSLGSKLSKYITKFIIFILNTDIAASSLLFHFSRNQDVSYKS